MAYLYSILFGLGVFGYCQAAEEPLAIQKMAGKSPVNIDILHWLLALIFVLVVFLILAWLLKKSSNLNLNKKYQLTIVAGLSLGMREKLVLVNVGEKQVLLSVTPGRIDKLLELEGEHRLCQNQEMDSGASMFAKRLQELMQSKGDVENKL